MSRHATSDAYFWVPFVCCLLLCVGFTDTSMRFSLGAGTLFIAVNDRLAVHDKEDPKDSVEARNSAAGGGAHGPSGVTPGHAFVQFLQTVTLSASFYYAFVLAQTKRAARRLARLRIGLVVILAF